MTVKAICRLAAIVGVASAAAASVAAPTAATTKPAQLRADVTGHARMAYVVPEDNVRFTFDAHATYTKASPEPVSVRGTTRISHYVAAHKRTYWAEGKVDCVMAAGRVATVTAVVHRASPQMESWLGKRLGYTVVDMGKDQLGGTGPMDKVDRCFGKAPHLAPAPMQLLREGGFKVRHNLPVYP